MIERGKNYRVTFECVADYDTTKNVVNGGVFPVSHRRNILVEEIGPPVEKFDTGDYLMHAYDDSDVFINDSSAVFLLTDTLMVVIKSDNPNRIGNMYSREKYDDVLNSRYYKKVNLYAE